MEKKDLPEEEKPVTPEQESKQAPQEEKRTFGARVRAFAGMCAEKTSAAAKKCAAFVKKTFSKEQSENELNQTEEAHTAKQAAVQADAQADKVSEQAKGAQVHTAKEAAAQSVVQADMQGTENPAQSETFEIDEESEIEAATTRTLSPARLVLKRFFRSKLSVTGLVTGSGDTSGAVQLRFTPDCVDSAVSPVATARSLMATATANSVTLSVASMSLSISSVARKQTSLPAYFGRAVKGSASTVSPPGASRTPSVADTSLSSA